MPVSNLFNGHDDQAAVEPAVGAPTSLGNAASLGALRRFARKREAPPPPLEHCELCGTALAPEHRHLLELSNRVVTCSCDACSLLFGKEGASEGKYRVIPRRYLALSDFQMTDAQWDELMIPVNMVYMFYNSVAKRVMAFYPSPAGAMESLLSLESWEMLASSNPVLHEMEPDVEALLINRVRDASDYYIVPIDACYRLVGLIRISWRGLSGGDEAWKAIADFFTDVQTRAMR
jgi:hypothetical protein